MEQFRLSLLSNSLHCGSRQKRIGKHDAPLKLLCQLFVCTYYPRVMHRFWGVGEIQKIFEKGNTASTFVRWIPPVGSSIDHPTEQRIRRSIYVLSRSTQIRDTTCWWARDQLRFFACLPLSKFKSLAHPRLFPETKGQPMRQELEKKSMGITRLSNDPMIKQLSHKMRKNNRTKGVNDRVSHQTETFQLDQFLQRW